MNVIVFWFSWDTTKLITAAIHLFVQAQFKENIKVPRQSSASLAFVTWIVTKFFSVIVQFNIHLITTHTLTLSHQPILLFFQMKCFTAAPWNYSSIPKFQRCGHWSSLSDEQFIPTLFCTWNYLSMSSLRLIHISKRDRLYFVQNYGWFDHNLIKVWYMACTSGCQQMPTSNVIILWIIVQFLSNV